MEKRVGLTLLGSEVLKQCLFAILQEGVVFGVLFDPLLGYRLKRSQDAAIIVFFPRIAKEMPDIFTAGVKYRHGFFLYWFYVGNDIMVLQYIDRNRGSGPCRHICHAILASDAHLVKILLALF